MEEPPVSLVPADDELDEPLVPPAVPEELEESPDVPPPAAPEPPEDVPPEALPELLPEDSPEALPEPLPDVPPPLPEVPPEPLPVPEALLPEPDEVPEPEAEESLFVPALPLVDVPEVPPVAPEPALSVPVDVLWLLVGEACGDAPAPWPAAAPEPELEPVSPVSSACCSLWVTEGPIPEPFVKSLTASAKTRTAASATAAAMMVARLRMALFLRARAASMTSGGAMGVPDSASSSTSALPLIERLRSGRVTPAPIAADRLSSTPEAAPASSPGAAWRSLSAEAERSDLYIWEAAAEAKPPISVPIMEPASPICAESAKEVAAARPEAMTVANEKSSKMPFFSSVALLFSDGMAMTHISKSLTTGEGWRACRFSRI